MVIKTEIMPAGNSYYNEKIVTMPEDYYFSSARNYAGLENELDVILLDLF